MNLLTTLLLFVISLSSLNCNVKTEVVTEPSSEEDGSVTLTNRVCYFSDVDSIQKKINIKISLPSSREIEEIKMLMNYVALPQNFSLYRGEVDNALATMVNNQRIIIYNKDLFAQIDRRSKSYWTSLFIIAHEVGHHLAYNITDTSDRKNDELEADIFAGSLLYKMGADSNQVIAAVSSNLISQLKDSKTHPAKTKRIEAVKKSWHEASVLRYQGATPPSPTDAISGDSIEVFTNEEFHAEEMLSFEISKNKIEELEIKSKGIITELEFGAIDERFDNYRRITKMLVKITGSKDSDFKRFNVGRSIWVQIPKAIYRQSNAQRLGFYHLMVPGRRISFSEIADNPHDSYLCFIKAED